MKFFDLFKKALKQEPKQSQDNLINKEAQSEKDRFSPKDKPFEWFSSEDGQKAFADVFTREMILKDSQVIADADKDFNEEGKTLYTYDFYVSFIERREKSILYFLKALTDALIIPTHYLGYWMNLTNYVIRVLFSFIKNCELNEDGDLVNLKQRFTLPELVDPNKNHILKYLMTLDVYDARKEEETAYDLITEGICFIQNEIENNNLNPLDNNQWLLEKSTYVSEAGTVRTKKGFFKTAISKTNSQLSKKFLENELAEC